MACSKFARLLISLVVLGSIPNAHAQGTSQNEYGGSASYATRPGGFYGTGGGTGVRTGRGPLSQPTASSRQPRKPQTKLLLQPTTKLLGPYCNESSPISIWHWHAVKTRVAA
jgi:hypothetical protein